MLKNEYMQFAYIFMGAVILTESLYANLLYTFEIFDDKIVCRMEGKRCIKLLLTLR